METQTIEKIKNRIDHIDKVMGELTTERFLLGCRHALLLKQAALANPPIESGKQFSEFYDANFGGTGFEENAL